MPRSLLPPRGVFAPTKLMFDHSLTPAVRDTALQLRALAWGKDTTPPLTMLEICQVTGKAQTTLYGHMRLLRDRGALRWRSAGATEIIVSFESAYWLCENPESELYRNPESPVKESDDLSFSEELKPIGNLQEGSNLEEVNDALQKSVKPKTAKKQAKRSSDWYYAIAQGLAEVCHMSFEANKGRLFGEAKAIEKATPEPTVELLREHYNGRAECYWRKSDWRGQKGQDPTPWAIRQTWGKWQYVTQPAGKYDALLRSLETPDNGHAG